MCFRHTAGLSKASCEFATITWFGARVTGWTSRFSSPWSAVWATKFGRDLTCTGVQSSMRLIGNFATWPIDRFIKHKSISSFVTISLRMAIWAAKLCSKRLFNLKCLSQFLDRPLSQLMGSKVHFLSDLLVLTEVCIAKNMLVFARHYKDRMRIDFSFQHVLTPGVQSTKYAGWGPFRMCCSLTSCIELVE